MVKFALVQGGLSMLALSALDQAVPQIFTPDRSIQALLHTVMPHLAAQQVLVSLTLVVESLAAGANQFGVLAVGTAASTAAAIWQIGLQSSVDGIWSLGITTLFAGRLATAVAACYRAIRIR
jgi:Na+-driven multidrug efflux pump